MNFQPTQLSGAWLIEPVLHRDARGFFTRTWCRDELSVLDLDVTIAQESASYTLKRGTLRGLHFQSAPHEETKIVRCIGGAIWDVIVDLRRESPTYLKWQGFELSAEYPVSLYIPKGLAHGFQTLTDHARVSYRISTAYAPAFARGYRFNDPVFGIKWPLDVADISDRDRGWPDFQDLRDT